MTHQTEIDEALARMASMAVGSEVVSSDEYTRQFPARGLPWRGIVKRVNHKTSMVTVKWLTGLVRREETLHPLFLQPAKD